MSWGPLGSMLESSKAGGRIFSFIFCYLLHWSKLGRKFRRVSREGACRYWLGLYVWLFHPQSRVKIRIDKDMRLLGKRMCGIEPLASGVVWTGSQNIWAARDTPNYLSLHPLYRLRNWDSKKYSVHYISIKGRLGLPGPPGLFPLSQLGR